MSICLLDTSILCEILQVPNRCENHREIYAQLEQKIKRETLLLPMSAIVETGNHIGQNGDGRQRRDAANRFVAFVRDAIRGETPFTTTPFFEPEVMQTWLEEFPNWATHGSGLGDLTIVQEFHRQCSLNPSRRVYIWTLDNRHLSSYDWKP
ncbi:MAG TPA: hypothetical protein VF173_14325 [Thermoanaerobaculia bacterium]|nr:hypothetical protein [Thermoanaerobaculia bacterium]